MEISPAVEDFVCAEAVARQAVGDAVSRGEVLLVAEDADDVAVGLYVDERATLALVSSDGDWLDAERFAARCVATEGVSHFVYFVFRAANALPVSQLELELQAEVDKYVAALLAGNRMAPDRERSRTVRRLLFDDAEFLDAADTEDGERYRVASRLAARYAAFLEERYVASGDADALCRELRRFYRLGLREKLAAASRAATTTTA